MNWLIFLPQLNFFRNIHRDYRMHSFKIIHG